MTAIPISDVRLRAFFALLAPAFVGHALQLMAEDLPWTELSLHRYWITPGWHLSLPPEVPAVIAALLALSVVALAISPTRSAFLAVAGLYAAHYLTYPWRIRNHMTTMLGGLVVVALVFLVARASGALTIERPRARVVDRVAVSGLAAVMTVQYFFAGLHKINTGFVDPALDSSSAAVSGLTMFWVYGDLGAVPPFWTIWLAIGGTIVIEMVAPLVAWRVRALTVPTVIVLMLFHVPHVAVMNVADYPMIASAFYPALFSHADAIRIARHLGPSRWTIGGALLGAATQLWFMPWWGRLTIFGIFVLALWGWAAGAMLQAWFATRRRARSTILASTSGAARVMGDST